MIDFGPGSTPFDVAGGAPAMRAMADCRIYVIETEKVRLS